jgi:hypothetical protein
MPKHTLLRILGARPTALPDGTPLPAHWEVYNAPRPLYGALTWDGEFRHGAFYGAVDPDDDSHPLFMATAQRRGNLRLDGWLVEWLDREATVREFAEGLARRYAMAVEAVVEAYAWGDRSGWDGLADAWAAQFGRVEVETP